MSDSEGDLDDVEQFSHSPVSSTLECLPGLFNRTDEDFCHEYFFSEVSHAVSLLQGLNVQRQQHTLCDVIICVGNQEFPCHRNVLAACSPYFKAMFAGELRESGEERVRIRGVDPDIMKQLIDFAYTSDISINQENAQHLLSAANMVQVHSIREACSNFLAKEMDPSNCLGIHCFAEAHECLSLASLSKQYTLRHFGDVTKHEEILLLPKSKFMEFLQSDELQAVSEDVVFEAVINWIKHDPETRSSKLSDVLQHVRLSMVNPYFLFDKLNAEPILMDNSECRGIVMSAVKHFVLKDRIGDFPPLTIARPRGSRTRHQLLYILGGEICNKNYLSATDCYDLDCAAWIRRKEMPFSRCQHCAVFSEGKYIYVAGGFNKDKQVLNSVLRYEPLLDKWVKVASMRCPRVRHAMVALDGYVYVAGGSDGQGHNYLNTVERYLPDTNQWELRTSMPEALTRCQGTAHCGYMYLAGGTAGPENHAVSSIHRYNPVSDSWDTLQHMPSPRYLLGLVPFQGTLIAIGGLQEHRTATKEVIAYDIGADRWIDMPQLTEARYDAGVAYTDNEIYVLSGHDGDNSFFHSIERYSTETNSWSIVSSTKDPYGRCRFTSVLISVPTC